MAAFPISQIVDGLRKFDGTSPVDVWLDKLEVDLDASQLDEFWILKNLDRVLRGGVKSWWLSHENGFITGVTAANAPAKWTTVKDAMIANFGGESLRQQAKIQNSALKFKIGDDPQDYVMRKLEILLSLNSSMTNARKIDHLIDGLPKELALQMLCSLDRDQITPIQFLNRLRSCVNYLSRNSKESSLLEQNFGISKNSLFSQNFKHKNPKDVVKHDVKFNQNEDVKQGQCRYCRKFGHYERECYKKARDDGRPLPPPKQPRHGGQRQRRNQGDSNPHIAQRTMQPVTEHADEDLN